MRAGALLGSRMLMLEHLGRKTGALRRVVLEVIDHPEADVFVVASGFGTHAQWFRNIAVHPQVRVWTRSHPPVGATARILDPPEADRALVHYREHHPRAWAQLKSVIEHTLGQPISDTDTALPMVELRQHPRG